METLLSLTVLICSTSLASGDVLPLFHHQAWHSAITLGKYLYIDGGELSTWDGKGNGYWNPDTLSGHIISAPDNFTHSIDLTSSWTNSSVAINKIPKSAPPLIFETLWPDESGQTFFASMGSVSGSIPPPDPLPPEAVWQFTPSGDTGSWSLFEKNPTDNNGRDIPRVAWGAYGSGNGLGFALGGIQWFDGIPIAEPGVVIFNSTSRTNYNVSAGNWNYYGTLVNGAAHFVPEFGPEGLLFVLAGSTSLYGLAPDPIAYSQFSPLSFDSIYMFEPHSRRWSQQQTTGDRPWPVINPCVTGLEGDNGTYEIFLFGGVNPNSIDYTIAMGAVYVLSLPSFHWTKQIYDPRYGRYGHQCNVVGKRQMAVTGGMVVDKASAKARQESYGYPIPDPWNQGIGIFDLSDMNWKDSYDADAEPYITPKSVRSYINEHGQHPSTWTSEMNKEWFTINQKDNSSASPPSPGSVSAGIIAGAVVGGVAGLALVVLGVFFWFRKSKRNKAARNGRQGGLLAYQNAELDSGTKTASELHHYHLNELQGSYSGTELPGKLNHAAGRAYEMES